MSCTIQQEEIKKGTHRRGIISLFVIDNRYMVSMYKYVKDHETSRHDPAPRQHDFR